MGGDLLSIAYRHGSERLRVELSPGQLEWQQPGAARFIRAANMGNNLTSKSRFSSSIIQTRFRSPGSVACRVNETNITLMEQRQRQCLEPLSSSAAG